MKQVRKIIDVPSGVNIHIEGSLVKIKGPKGENSRNFRLIGMNLEHKNNQLVLSTAKTTRNFKRNLNSIASHIKNMVKGVLEIYVYKLKICSGHFPMNVALDKNEIIVKNFLGEKIPRRALVLPNVKVKVEKDIITVESHDKEKAGQTASNIESSTRITDKDRRVFMDGIWMIEKAGKELK